jgi:hypothetical protein
MDALAAPFNPGEIEQASCAGGQKKAPGREGLTSEFYKHTWKISREGMVEIINQMFWEGHMNSSKKQGEIICLPKRSGTDEPSDFRPITLLNTDYKVLARLVARCLGPMLAEHLKDTQYCGVLGNSILDAAATIRDTIAIAETEKVPLCVLSIDFKNAFDNIAHEYLLQMLCRYGIADFFITGIKNMYERASSSVQINRHSYGPIPIQCSVRQGCPMSMVLYMPCLHPFLSFLNQKMERIKIGNRMCPTAIVAYADDVTIFVAAAADFAIMEETIKLFYQASGAHLNPCKSKALATGGWNTTDTICGIEYYQADTILGVTFWGTTRQSMDDTWAWLTG